MLPSVTSTRGAIKNLTVPPLTMRGRNHSEVKFGKIQMRKSVNDHTVLYHDTRKVITKSDSDMIAKESQTLFIPRAPPDFADVLKKRANSSSREIVLSVVDETYWDFAVNFYETSLQKLKVHNFLMVCLDRTAQSRLAAYNISCYYFPTSLFTGESSLSRGDFGTEGYYLKTNLKTLVLLHALRAGYNVLLVDLDIVFLKNPFKYLTCVDCDLQVQQDPVHLNSGFVYVRPTPVSLLLYQTVWQKYLKYKLSHDQAYLNMVVRIFEMEKREIKIERLSFKMFPCGKYYFTTTTFWRMFGDMPCEECVIVHNNHIGSLAAKKYRFRENQMWSVDVDGYYSNQTAKYLIYDNPAFFSHGTLPQETDALRSALAIGNLTDRIVILPGFHCCDCQRKVCGPTNKPCNLLTVLKLRTFDEAFKGKYREHTFLKNPKVPQRLKDFVDSSTRKVFRINSTVSANTPDEHQTARNQFIDFVPKNPDKGATEREVRDWLGSHSQDPVLFFHSLYGAFNEFDDINTAKDFQSRIDQSFACVGYDQWEVKARH